VSALSIRDLTVVYGSGKRARTVVDGVSLDIAPGRVLGLVGESGSGKSTVARSIFGLTPMTDGTVEVDGQDLATMPARQRASQVQMVFQDPNASLDPRMSVGELIGEGMTATRRIRASDRRTRVAETMEMVALDTHLMGRMPRALSGGQRQRVAIARALALHPKVIVADEITSALDVSVQAQVLNLLRGIQHDQQMAMLFISHSLAVIRYIVDDVAVIYAGQIVETGPVEDVLATPQHPYTRALIAAVPRLGEMAAPDTRWLPIAPPQEAGEVSAGCRYQHRCPIGPVALAGRDDCLTVDPVDGAGSRPHRVACHHAGDVTGPLTPPANFIDHIVETNLEES
jgi:peptide/nickel transport system ATP-binding protein